MTTNPGQCHQKKPPKRQKVMYSVL